MKNIIWLLALLFVGSTAQSLLGEVTVLSSNGDGLLVRKLQVPSGVSISEASYPVDGSSLQSAALTGAGQHPFSLEDGSQCVVMLKNSTRVSAVVQCEDGDRDPYDITYPDTGGCLPTYLQDGLSNGHIFYIGYAGSCIPLRVQVDSITGTLVRVRQEHRRDLSGNEGVVVTKAYQEVEAIFYAYIKDNELIFLDDEQDTTIPFSATEIGQCSTLEGLQPLPTGPGLVLDCADQTGTNLRYLVHYNDQELDRIDPVSEAEGSVRVSDNRDFLAIMVNSGNVHYVALYNTTNILQGPERIGSQQHIHDVEFLKHGNGTVLVMFIEGQNIELVVDVSHFISTHGEGRPVEVPDTTVHSCDPCPFSGIVANNFFMVAVRNLKTSQFDLKYTQLGSNTVAEVHTIPRVSSASPVFQFARLEVIPAGTENGDQTTTNEDDNTTTTNGGGVPTSEYLAFLTLLVLAVAVAIVLVIVFVCYQVCYEHSWWSERRKKIELPKQVHDNLPQPPIQETSITIDSPMEESPSSSIPVSQSTSTHSLNSSSTQSVQPSPLMPHDRHFTSALV